MGVDETKLNIIGHDNSEKSSFNIKFNKKFILSKF